MTSLARQAADRALRRQALARAALRRAGRRQRAIVLLWHRVAPEGPRPHEVLRTVTTDDFRIQLDLLADLGDIVPLDALESGSDSGRPRFALTFDDDNVNHARHVLPVLRERDVPATFFLSGRWLFGYGPYWWEVLEDRIQRSGAETVAADLGVPGAPTPPRIAAAITGTAAARELADEGRGRLAVGMDGDAARALVVAGMEIGFHTVDHHLLTSLDDEELAAALVDGRDDLAAAAGTPLERFAYPHGGVDGRVAAATAAAGYRTAWTTAKVLDVPDAPRMRRGRWDVGHLPLGHFRSRLLRALARPRP